MIFWTLDPSPIHHMFNFSTLVQLTMEGFETGQFFFTYACLVSFVGVPRGNSKQNQRSTIEKMRNRIKIEAIHPRTSKTGYRT